MARTNRGKWVARAAATGGGRTYRGQVPINWYAALIVIVVLGVLSVVFARYQYQHPASASTVQPTTTTTWYAGFAFDVCGKELPPVAANATSSTVSTKSFYTPGKGLIVVSPKTSADTGDNAVLGKFVDGYHGMKLSSSSVTVPSGKKSTTYRNGQTCPSGTPDAGKRGQVQVAYWPSAFASKAKPTIVSGDPTNLKFSNNQLITIGFVPAGTKLPKPTGKVVTALIQASAALGNSTTTTAPGTSSTTTPAPSSTTTTAPSTTTTAPSTTTTAPASSTTAPASSSSKK
jgi:hypothetical protein